jgi:hypothetical protein
MGKGGMGGGGMGAGGQAFDVPCSQIMVRTALDGAKEWTIIEMQVSRSFCGEALNVAAMRADQECADDFAAQGEFETRDERQDLNSLEIGNLVCKGCPLITQPRESPLSAS